MELQEKWRIIVNKTKTTREVSTKQNNCEKNIKDKHFKRKLEQKNLLIQKQTLRKKCVTMERLDNYGESCCKLFTCGQEDSNLLTDLKVNVQSAQLFVQSSKKGLHNI